MQEQFDLLQRSGFEPIWTAPNSKHPNSPWASDTYSRKNIPPYQPGFGLGILTGYRGVVALDFDVVRDAGYDHISADGKIMDGRYAYELMKPCLEGTQHILTKTPTGGFHVIMRAPQGWAPKTAANVLKTEGRKGESCLVSVDVRAAPGFLMVGPSTYPGSQRAGEEWKNEAKGFEYSTSPIIPASELDFVPAELVEIFKAGGFAVEDGVMVPKSYAVRPAAPKKRARTAPKIKREEVEAPLKECYESAELLLKALNKDRWQDRTEWFELACATKHAFGECPEDAFELWKRYSIKRYEKAAPPHSEFVKVWDSIDEKESQKQAGSLIMWACEDDPDVMKRAARKGLLLARESLATFDCYASFDQLTCRKAKSSELIEWWKQNVRWVLNDGVYYLRMRNEETGEINWRIKTINAFEREGYKNTFDLGGEKRVTMTTFFSSQSHLVQVRDAKFMPCGPSEDPQAIPNVLNTFVGFASSLVELTEEAVEKAQFVLDHIRDVWCAGNEEHYDYVLKWLAYVVQVPRGERTQVALVLRSQKGGVGKGVIIEFLRRMLGEAHAIQLAGVDELLTRFNGIQEYSCLTNVDEAKCHPSQSNRIKNLITEKTFSVEHKQINMLKNAINHQNFIFSTNEAFSFHIKSTAESRRFCVLECSDIHANDRAHMDKLWGLVRDKEARDALLTVLNNVDLTNYSPFADNPITEAKTALQAKAVSVSARMFISYLAGDDHAPTFRATQKGEFIVESQPLFQKYLKVVENENLPKSKAMEAFKSEVSDILGKFGRYTRDKYKYSGWMPLTRDELEDRLVDSIGRETFELLME